MVFQDDQGKVRALVISPTSSLKGLCTNALRTAAGVECLPSSTSVSGAERFFEQSGPMVAVVELADFELQGIESLLNGTNGYECAVITIVPSLEKQFVIDALRSGVRGFLTHEVESSELVRAVKGVGAGEIWVSRELLYDALFDDMEHSVNGHDEASDELGDLLTPREKDIVSCLRQGLSDKEIARSLGISHKTVKTHLQHIFRKTKMHSRLQLAIRG